MKDLKKIAISIGFTFIIFAVIDCIAGFVCEKMYRESKTSLFARQHYIVNESTDDVIILGSSRAAHHYVPEIITEGLGLSCHNAGSDGMCIYYHYALLSAMIERGHTPKIVICDLLNTDVSPSKEATFTLDAAISRLAPEYGKYAIIDSTIQSKDGFEGLLMHSALYRYNSQLVQLARCRFSSEPYEAGYERLDGTMDEQTKRTELTESTGIEKEKVQAIEKLITLCKKHHIDLRLCLSPLSTNNLQFKWTKPVAELAKKHNIPLYDFMRKTDKQSAQDHGFSDDIHFKDRLHLNHEGAKLYTEKVTKLLK